MQKKNYPKTYSAIIDANLNRASEGLRVIEDYCRFLAEHKKFTDQLNGLRKTLNAQYNDYLGGLVSRDISKDQRAKEAPAKRQTTQDILIANFKRVTEALRVLEEYSQNAVFNQLRYDVYECEKQVVLAFKKASIKKGIYLISADPEILKKGLEWGVSLIQYRNNAANKETVYNICAMLQPLASKANIPMMVNNFLDIALLVKADGLHTGQDDLPIDVQRKLLGDHLLIGKTCHDLNQALDAQKQGADYVSAGPIWQTPSKPSRKAIGFDYLSQAKKALSIPYVAIGGINTQERFDEVLAYTPPLIGVVRAADCIPQWQTAHQQACSKTSQSSD